MLLSLTRVQRSVAWTLCGNVIYAGCQYGIISVIAKLADVTMVGHYALALAIATPIFTMSGLQLRVLLATDSTGEFAFAEFLRLRTVATAAALALLGLVALVLSLPAVETGAILAVGLYKALESWSDLYYGAMQRRHRMDWIAWSLMLRAGSGLLAFTAVLYLTHSLIWGVCASMAPCALALLGFERPRAHASLAGYYCCTEVRLDRILQLAGMAAPLGVAIVLLSYSGTIPRYFIRATAGTRDLGIFAALASLMQVGMYLIIAIGQTASAPLSERWRSSRERFRLAMRRLLALAAALGLAGVVVAYFAGDLAIRILFRPEYAGRRPALLWLMTAAALSCLVSVMGFGLTAARMFTVQVPLCLVLLVTTTALSAVLVPRLGLLGASIAITLSWAVMAACMGVVAWKAGLLSSRFADAVLLEAA